MMIKITERSEIMTHTTLPVATIAPEHVESINYCQSKIKTQDGNDVVLIAYEKK